MRLIDADELKVRLSEDIIRTFQRWDKKITVAEMETWVRDEIDNIPTAVDELKEAYREGYHDGHSDGYLKAINEDGAKCENPKVIFDDCDMNLFDPEKENNDDG